MIRKLALLLLASAMLAASGGPSGTIAGPFGDVRLGGEVEFTLDMSGFPGGDKVHYRVGAWPMVSAFCWQDVNGDGVISTTITSPDVVFGQLVKPYYEDDGALVAEFPAFGYISDWSNYRGGEATCEGVLWSYSVQGDVTQLDSTGLFTAGG